MVYVLSAMNGCIRYPRLGSADGYEEERRLLYVALTRAADHLYVTYKEGVEDEFRGVPPKFRASHRWVMRILTPKPIKKLFQIQYASQWKEVEQVR